MLEHGTVVSVTDDRVTVAVEMTDRCQSCRGCRFTGRGMTMEVQAVQTLDVKPGDRVVIEVPTELAMRAAWMVYVLPLLGLITGVAAGQVIVWLGWVTKGASWPSLLLGLVGVVGAFTFVVWQERRLGRDPARQVRIVERVHPGDEDIEGKDRMFEADEHGRHVGG